MSVYPRTEFLTSWDAQRNPFIARCDVPTCYYIISAPGEQQAWIDLAAHQRRTCPMTGNDATLMNETDERGQRYTKPNIGKSTAEVLWDRLDEVIAEIKQKNNEEDVVVMMHVEMLKGEATGLAWAIQLMCRPFYESYENVLKQANRRWRIAQGELSYEPTPGYKYNPPPPGKFTKPAPVPATNGSKVLSEQELDSLRKAHHAGGFSPIELSRAFEIPVTQVKSLLGLT